MEVRAVSESHVQIGSMAQRCRAGIETLFPGYFAMVMATGIVSIAADLHGMPGISQTLFWVNGIAYVVLWTLTLIRLVRFPRRLISDLLSHSLGVTFNTMVAATCVLGAQFALLTPWIAIARGLWFGGLALWLVLNYTFFTAVTVREPKPSIETGLNGAWLIIVVGTESIAVLGLLVANSMPAQEIVRFVSLGFYFVGAMLYIALITLILYRWMFFSMAAATFKPPYWINMGALAITTLAGSRLMIASQDSTLLGDFVPFLRGFTLFFWSMATWWIPLLVIAGIWRHGFERVPLRYDPLYWSLVFPLGMYTVATSMYARASGIEFLAVIPRFFVFIALGAWAVVFIGLLRHLASVLLARQTAP